MTIGLVTALARADEVKGRKKRERQRAGLPPEGSETAAADGARIGHDMRDEEDGEHQGADSIKAAAFEAARGICPGPDTPMQPGQLDPAGLNRPYIAAGHGAPSPQYRPPDIPHVDLSQDRGQMVRLNPHAPTGPGGQS